MSDYQLSQQIAVANTAENWKYELQINAYGNLRIDYKDHDNVILASFTIPIKALPTMIEALQKFV